MIVPKYSVGIEFESGSFTDVTSDVMQMTIARELGYVLNGLSAGEAQVELGNQDGQYSPDNPNSSFSGLMRPNLDIKITGNWPSGVFFDGETMLNSDIDFSDVMPNGKAGTIAVYFRPTDLSGSNKVLYSTFNSGQEGLIVWIDTSDDGAVEIQARDSGDNLLMEIRGTSQLKEDAFYALVASWDLSTPGARHVFLNGSDETTENTFIDGIIDWDLRFNIGAFTSGFNKYTGDMTFVWFADEYIDLSVRENREAFFVGDEINFMNKPVPSIRPQVFMHGDADLFPTNPGGTYTGDITENGTLTDGGETNDLFRGTIDEWSPSPDLSSPRKTLIQARDVIKKIRRQTVTTSLFTNYNVGSLFTEVLNQSGVNSRSVDTLVDELPFVWFRDRKADNVIKDMIESGFYFAYVDGSGIFNVKRRYFEIEGTTVGSLDEFYGVNYSLTDDKVYNEIKISGEPRELASSIQKVAFLSNPLTIQASSHVGFFLEYIDPEIREPVPAREMVTPVNSKDYTTNTSSDGSGTDRTSTTSASVTFFGQTSVNTVFNGSGDIVFLDKYILRGKPVQRRTGFTATAEDSSSQNVYGPVTFTLDNALIGDPAYGQDYADFVLFRHKNPDRDVGLTLRNDFHNQLGVEPGNMLHVVNTHLGLSSLQIIESIAHTVVLEQGLIHQTEYGLLQFVNQEVLILDDEDLGKLDSRRLGF